MDALIRFVVSGLALVIFIAVLFAIDPIIGAITLFFGVPIMWYVTGIGAE